MNLGATPEILLNMKQEIYILHGWAIDSNNEKKWELFRTELSKANITTYFLALPGLTTSLSKVWGLDDYVNWLKDQLKGKENIVLLGHSFGGQIAIRYSAQNPKQISKLILIDSAGIIDNSILKQTKRAVFGCVAKLGKKVTKKEIFRKLLYKLVREKDYLEANTVQRQTMANVISEEIIDDLSKIKCPTQIIWGEQDKSTPIKLGKMMQERISNSSLKIISQARHSPQFTHVDATVSVVKEFLT